MKRLLFTATIAIFLSIITQAQVTTSPAFIEQGYEGEIIITFDPTQGNKGMVGATKCYAHTGLITEKSSSSSDWNYATTTWRGEEAKYQMTQQGDKWVLTIPNIYTYYGCPKSEKIKSIAFVFNDGKGGTKEGKTADGKDIIIDLVEVGLFSVKFNSPNQNTLVKKETQIEFTISSSIEAQLSLTINNEKVASTSSSSTLSYKYTFATEGDYTCVAKAEIDNKITFDTIYVCVSVPNSVEPRPIGLQDGITYYDDDPTRATLSMYAKDINGKIVESIYVIGDFNNWSYSSEYQMKQDGETGYFWLDITGLEPEKEYIFQYAVTRADGTKVQVSDPYTEKVIDNDCAWIPNDIYPNLQELPSAAQGPAAVLQTAHSTFDWSDATLNFSRPNKDNLIIYEVWVYDFCPYRSIAGLTKRLDYIENLGVNAIELMPVCEFEGNISWGYNPTHYFAFDKAYGTPNDFKSFVDECHKRGIAVIMDMVFNHCTGLNPMNKLFPLKDNPFFNKVAPHAYKIFEDFNHEFEQTNSHFTRVLNYWLDEYKIDGYRMDVSHGLCGYNCSNIVGIIDSYYQNGVKAIAEDAYFILEHWPWEDGRGDSERNDLVNRGMMCWTNTNNAYSQTAMGWLKDGDSFQPATYDGFVTYCGSHDEERNFYKALRWGNGQIISDTTARYNRIAANVAMNVMLNGPQMIWQFDEIGYDYSINYNSYNGKEEESGRTSPKPMPEGLGYFASPLRMKQYQKLGQMIQLRTRLKPELFSGNPTQCSVGGGQSLRSVTWADANDQVYVISNLNAAQDLTYTLPSNATQWYDYLTDHTTPFNANTTQTLHAGEVKVWTSSYISLPEIPDQYIYTDTTIFVGTNEITTLHCHLYPTITDGIINIESDECPQQIAVVSLSGQQLITQSGHNTQLNVSPLPRGLYIVTVMYDHSYKTFKIYRM